MSRFSIRMVLPILALTISLSLTTYVDTSLAQGTPPTHAFKGNIVNAAGNPVRDGANMKALIDGNTVAQSTAQGGQYKLIVTQPQGVSFSGKTVTFTVGQYKVNETAKWQPGSNSVMNLTGQTQQNTINRARGAIAGFIDPNRTGSQNQPPQDPQQDSRALEQRLNKEKEQRIAQIRAGFQQVMDQAQIDADREKEEAKLNYDMELRNIENDSGQNGEASMHQQELDETQRQYDDAKQRGAGRQHLDELERRLIRVRGNLERARSQSTGDKSRRISNAKMEYDRRVSQADRQLREQLSRMKQEMSREIGNIEREFGQQLQSQKEEAQRQQSEQQRMAREEQSQQKRMDMERQRDEQRFQQEEDRMKREMEMQEERMNREMQMDEQRMRMEEDRMRRMGQGSGPGMGPGGQGPDGMAPGVPMKTRGFLMNPKPGSQAQGFNAAMDPTMLAMIGIAITVLATGLTLFKGN